MEGLPLQLPKCYQPEPSLQHPSKGEDYVYNLSQSSLRLDDT